MSRRQDRKPRNFALMDDGEIIETPYPIDTETKRARKARDGREVIRQWCYPKPTRNDLYCMLIEAQIVGNSMTVLHVHHMRLKYNVDDEDIKRFMKMLTPELTYMETSDGPWMVYPDIPAQAPIGSGPSLWDALVDHWKIRYKKELEHVKKVPG